MLPSSSAVTPPPPATGAAKATGFTWGHAMTLVFVGFGLFIGQFIWRAVAADSELVADKPYEQGMAYQQDIDALQRGKALQHLVVLTQTASGVRLQMPTEATQGQLHLQRPDRRAEDRKLTFASGQTEFRVPLRRGRWRAIIQWQQGGQAYRVDRELFVP